MKIVVVYVYPAHCCDRYDDYTIRFLDSYTRNRPAIDHDSLVMVCGGKPDASTLCMFSTLRNVQIVDYNNDGWDIGAFQWAARNRADADMMVFFGSTAWIKGPAWLERMAGSMKKLGDHLYGSMGNRGNPVVNVHPHIRTTGFWMRPGLLNEYPYPVRHPSQRYPFEHGPHCLTQWVWSKGRKAFVVSWGGEYEWKDWDNIPNGYHQGNQSACLTGDRNSDPPFHPVP